MKALLIAGAAAAGALVGHLLRRATPGLAQVRADRIPFRGPWFELLAAAYVGGVAARFGFGAPQWLLFALLLLAATATDFYCKLIPDRITYPGAIMGLVCSLLRPAGITGFLGQARLLEAAGLGGAVPYGPWGGLLLSLLGAVAGFGLLEGFRRLVGLAVGMEVLGMGDSKLLGMAGAFLGPGLVLLSLLPALGAGIVLGVPYTRIARTPHLPFGPALALGALLALLCGDAILDGWSAFTGLARDLPPWGAKLTSLILLAIAVLLLLRVRRRRADYTKRIEEDYDKLEEKDP